MRDRKVRHLQSAGKSELTKNACEVMFNGALTNSQILSYLFVGITISNPRDNIFFS